MAILDITDLIQSELGAVLIEYCFFWWIADIIRYDSKLNERILGRCEEFHLLIMK